MPFTNVWMKKKRSLDISKECCEAKLYSLIKRQNKKNGLSDISKWCPNFLVWISKNGQRLASEHHFDMLKNLYLFWYLKMAQRTILRCSMTHFFIRMAKNGQSSASEHHFMLSKHLFFVKTSEHGQSLPTEHHLNIVSIWT